MNTVLSGTSAYPAVKPIPLFEAAEPQETAPAPIAAPQAQRLQHPEETMTGTLQIFWAWLTTRLAEFGQNMQDWSLAYNDRKVAKQRALHRSMTESQLRAKFAGDSRCGCEGSSNCVFCNHMLSDMGLVQTRMD